MQRRSSEHLTLNNFFEATHGLVVEVGKTGRESIGGGAHSDVWKASMRAGEVQRTVAVKCVRWYANMEYDSEQATKTLKRLVSELNIWKKLKHPYVLPLFGICYWESSVPSLVSPWMNNGTSKHYLETHHEVNPLKFIQKIAEGLSYLHAQSHSHGDIKGDNVLVDDLGNPVLADFGLSRTMKELGTLSQVNTQSSATTSSVDHNRYPFSLRWADIQYLKDTPSRRINFLAADIWAFGRLVLELWTNRVPFCDIPDEGRVISYILAGKMPLFATCYNPPFRKFNHVMELFCYDCWKENITRRPTMTQIVRFLSQLYEKSQSNPRRRPPVDDEESEEDESPPSGPPVKSSDSEASPPVGSLIDFDYEEKPVVLGPNRISSPNIESGSGSGYSFFSQRLVTSPTPLSPPLTPLRRGSPVSPLNSRRTRDQERSSGELRSSSLEYSSSSTTEPARASNIPLISKSTPKTPYIAGFRDYLNENNLRPFAKWRFEDRGPSACPQWYCTLKIRDKELGFGGAPTKKSAQNEAARCAGQILQNPDILRVLSIKDPVRFEQESHIITAALAQTKLQLDLTDVYTS